MYSRPETEVQGAVDDDALFAVVAHGEYPSEIVPNERAVPGPSPWNPLHRALVAVTETPDLLRDEDASFVYVVLDVPPADWTHQVAERAHRLLSGPYRDALEDAGWDVDLLPIPERLRVEPTSGYAARTTLATPADRALPAAPAPAAPAAPSPTVPVQARQAAPAASTSAASLVTLTASGDQARLHAPAGHPLNETSKAIPGATWNSTDATWHFPITRRVALALRAHLTGHAVSIDTDLATRLREAANSDPLPDVAVANDRIEIRFEHTPDLQADVKRMANAQWDGPAGCWWTGIENAAGALKFADTHAFLATRDVVEAAEKRYEPFDYDLTIDGLRGVPVSELHAVRSVPARNVGKKNEFPSLEDRLAKFGVESVYDLLSVVPRRYIDRSKQTPIRDLKVGDEVTFLARVIKIGQWDRTKRMMRISVGDGTGNLEITFFNQPWMQRRFRVKDEVVVHGRLDAWAPKSGPRKIQMTNPMMDPVGDDIALIVPVYPQSEKVQISTWDLHGPAMEAVRRLGDLQDPIPTEVRDRHALMGRVEAYRQVHHPDTLATAAQARTRLAFDELFRMQMTLGMRRHAMADETGVTHNPTGVLSGQFVDGLRFDLTGAQKRALGEITADLKKPHPMHRLLQGDVGAGKSAVAMVSLLAAVEGGYQGALMAPTEILATQLHAELADELSKINHPDGRMLVVEFLAAKTKVKDKRRILAGLAAGEVDIVVGTHALLVDEVEFANLGLVVIDEQHRFGVEQRAALRGKGKNGTPDMLVMTATPIPRTSAMTVYGDLEVSVLDELPPGRTPIQTSWLDGEPELDVITGPPWDLVRREIEAGRQAYVVASLVEDNEKIAAQSAEAALESLENGALAGLRLGLVHGKQPREEREETMLAFKRGDLDVLIATTVIEVGVNVPNATVMVVLDATRFGIAQLHQIRGRVGRGQHKSYCVLTGKAGSADSIQRMEALVESTDGFYLSEVDLNLRGEGSIFGARQSGQTDLRVASLKDDRDLILTCRQEANALLENDPKLKRRPGLRNEVHSALGPDAEEWLDRS